MKKFQSFKKFILFINFLAVIFLIYLSFFTSYDKFSLWIAICLLVTSIFLLVDGFSNSSSEEEEN